MLQLEITQPHVSASNVENNYGRFVIEPLETGYGHTLGNSLRRVLLSSLPGAAVTSIKIDGVSHEFQAIPHVKEDVTEIVLNIKRLRLTSLSDGPVEMRLDIQGETIVTAADIQAPSPVTIITPELQIATLDSPDARLSMVLVVEQGRGYRQVDTKDDQPIGQIPVDAIFTPITRVNYIVENTRVGQMTNYDRVVMEIWTDGSITPEDALHQSAQILVRHFAFIGNQPPEDVPAAEPGKPSPSLSTIPIPAHVYDMSIESLELSVRAYNCLKRSNITKIGQVLSMTQDDLMAVRNFGEKSLVELREKLLERNLLPTPAQIAQANGSGRGNHSED